MRPVSLDLESDNASYFGQLLMRAARSEEWRKLGEKAVQNGTRNLTLREHNFQGLSEVRHGRWIEGTWPHLAS